MKMRWLACVMSLAFAGSAWADTAEEIWTSKCKSCHGADGKAQTKEGKKDKVPDMTTAKWQAEMGDADVRKIISDGSDKKGSKMKAFKEKLSPEEIDSLVAYIRAMKAK
jgi:mono/diheme cytochrome c family protein